MNEAVSINRCAKNLGVPVSKVRAAIELGLVVATKSELLTGPLQTVVPCEVFAALVKAGTLTRCPCCNTFVGTPDDTAPGGNTAEEA